MAIQYSGEETIKEIFNQINENKIDKNAILDSQESVEENSESGYVVDALVIKSVFQSVSDGKELIASAITDKGISTDASDTFLTMANNIAKISSGGQTDINIITISHSYSTAGGTKTYDLTSYTDQWENLVMGTNLFIVLTAMIIPANKSLTNSNSYAQSWTLTPTRNYNASTGVLTIKNHASFGTSGTIYILET
ncbi:MAG: hypothetical protein LUI12_01775 [Clostridiales bacterium]|nr:hypothetical protein [Clostridiales bacterium]